MLYRQIQTRAEGESLYLRYNTDANVVNGLKNSSSYEPTGERSLEIDEVYAEKIKVKVYVNQKVLYHSIQTLIKNVFLLNFAHALLMSFLKSFIGSWRKYNKRVGPSVARNKMCSEEGQQHIYAQEQNCITLIITLKGIFNKKSCSGKVIIIVVLP